MGEKYLGQLTAKSAPATGDIMVLEDSEDTKKIDYDALANAILNKLTTKTYTVAGGTNTLIAAIDALNSNTYSLTGGTALAANTNLNTITTPGNYVSASASVSGLLVNSPVTNMGFSLKVENVNNELAILQRITTRGATVQVYERTATLGGGTTTWDGEWKLVPTRAEIDALNSNLSNLYCREYSYAAGTSYKAAVTDVLSKLGNTIARYWIIIRIGVSCSSLIIIKDGVQWSNGILTTYGSTTTDVYFVMSRADASSNTVVSIRKLLTGDLEE